MKRRLLSALMCGCMLLSGCASMLERDYVSVTPHTSTTTDEGSSSVLRVETYQELVNSLIYFISSGAETGVIRLYMDADLVAEQLRTARLEVLNKYPLAAYAVQNITFDVETLETFSETDIQLTYRRSKTQISSIVSATGISAVRSELASALKQFSPECVLRISYFDRDETFIRTLIQQVYYAAPDTALEYPQLDVHIYPDSGVQRIVEVLFHYEADPTLLEERAILLEQACIQLTEELPTSGSATDILSAASKAILAQGGYKADGGPTAYHALLDGGADCEGLALAMAAVCQTLDVNCQVARGLLNGEPHFWNVVSTENGWRHLDLSRYHTIGGFYTDDIWRSHNYQWTETALPFCT